PEDKITKGDLLDYYHQVAPFILPYLVGRPMSLHRHPNGFDKPSFYQKDVTDKAPDWVETMPCRSDEEPDVDKEFLVCSDEATLLYMANLGCIEMNPWSSTAKKPNHPDWCILDLDPSEKTDFEVVIEIARLIYDLLQAADVPCFCKTSGSEGLHIYIPLGQKYTHEQSTNFAHLIAGLVESEMPKHVSLERSVKKREGKLYLDYLQNKDQATVAAPYSVRPKPHAPVSMPLEWEEVKSGLRNPDFTIRNVLPMLAKRGDLFKGVLGKGVDVEGALEALQGKG
ncbi:MAG: non-homologous end-joining DNA ligase, partial [Saprospiraceae bacterium]|nr:non-homologous end-joining DNA ligase [Saprospiraceae bacterium]